jgi:hypothetical protein
MYNFSYCVPVVTNKTNQIVLHVSYHEVPILTHFSLSDIITAKWCANEYRPSYEANISNGGETVDDM